MLLQLIYRMLLVLTAKLNLSNANLRMHLTPLDDNLPNVAKGFLTLFVCDLTVHDVKWTFWRDQSRRPSYDNEKVSRGCPMLYPELV